MSICTGAGFSSCCRCLGRSVLVHIQVGGDCWWCSWQCLAPSSPVGGHIFLYLPFHNLFRVEWDKTDTDPLSQSSPHLAPLLFRMSPTGPSKSPLPVSWASLAGSLAITRGTFPTKSALSLLLKTTQTPPGHLDPFPGHHLLPKGWHSPHCWRGWPAFQPHGKKRPQRRSGQVVWFCGITDTNVSLLPACGGTQTGQVAVREQHCHQHSHPVATCPQNPCQVSACLLGLLPTVSYNIHHSSLLIMPTNTDLLKLLLLRSSCPFFWNLMSWCWPCGARESL